VKQEHAKQMEELIKHLDYKAEMYQSEEIELKMDSKRECYV